MTWIRNNILTLVEIVIVLLEAISLVLNAVVRLVPNNTFVKNFHDAIKFIEAPARKLKSFLLTTGG